MAEKVVRGKIISSDGKVLAQTLTENGSEIRDYPYGRMFAHVVGYNDKGKSGLESPIMRIRDHIFTIYRNKMCNISDQYQK